jgi:hypothetical protein
MKTDRPLVDLLPPQGCALKAAAFSWQGDKLWLCLEEEGAPSRRKLAVWNVPAECIDATSPRHAAGPAAQPTVSARFVVLHSGPADWASLFWLVRFQSGVVLVSSISSPAESFK